jgi:hypothetical protein
MAIKATISSFCFQPGVGWLQRPPQVNTATRTFQTIPVSELAGAAKAQKLERARDSEDCNVSTPGAGVSLANLVGGGDTGLTLSGQSQGTASNTPSSASPQSDSFASSSGSANQGSQGPLAAFMVAPGESGTNFSFSRGLTRGSMPITPSVSSEGDLYFSIFSPELAKVEAADTTHSPLVGVTIYSFSPGRDTSASRSMLGEKANHVSSGTLEKERNRVIGYETEELKSQEQKASVEKPIAAEDLHAYRQLRYACLKIVAAQETGGVSNILNMEISGGQKVTELARLREDCGQFLVLGRDAAIRKMQKHKGLK